MRVRKLLLIHPKRSTRALIKKYIFSELSDIETLEAEGGPNALHLINTEAFDVIVTADRLKAMELIRLKEKQMASQANAQTPLIVISESESNHHRNELAQQGFDRVVQIRMRPADLIQKINAVCNPRDWRKDDRYHLPGVGVLVNMADLTIDATLINLSKGGILVEITMDQPEKLLQNEVTIGLRIPMAESMATIDGLSSKVLRIEVVTWETAWVPRVMRITFIFQGLRQGVDNKLEELIQMAKEDRLPAVEIVS